MRAVNLVLAIAILALTVASPAEAYIGPGAGLGAIAAILGGIAAFFMMLAGLVWYPVKAMLRKRREAKRAAAGKANSKAPVADADQS